MQVCRPTVTEVLSCRCVDQLLQRACHAGVQTNCYRGLVMQACRPTVTEGLSCRCVDQLLQRSCHAGV